MILPLEIDPRVVQRGTGVITHDRPILIGLYWKEDLPIIFYRCMITGQVLRYRHEESNDGDSFSEV